MSELKTTSVHVTSRASVKISDSFYTFEFGKECSVPEEMTADELAEAKHSMWDEANAEVDNQISEIYNFLHKKK